MKNITEQIKQFYHENESEDLDLNCLYFEYLLGKKDEATGSQIILRTEENDATVYPYAIASNEVKEHLKVQKYEELSDKNVCDLKESSLSICKMQAGLGSSVKRDDLLKKYTNRDALGAKGTDLFIDYEGKMISIAEAQLHLALQKSEFYKDIKYVNLVNEETLKAVGEVWKQEFLNSGKSYLETFNSTNAKAFPEIMQYKMPTIDEETGDISFERLAPAGHGFLGFYKLAKIFRAKKLNDDIFVIGNGEDLRSTPDEKILSWVKNEEIPIVMITTTKLEKDKKGGQIAVVMDESPYVTIVEKAQAQRAGQLEYFEKLGLRPRDDISLFNTNIVIINEKALKKSFNKYLDMSESEFFEIIMPDLIKNVKTQGGKSFIQLEGAIGSVLLNLDKYFRLNFNTALVNFLNLNENDREKFFLPIKTREDFDAIYKYR